MTLFLIAHKVRGSPAFDIAERCDDMGTPSDPGPWWIIPTSGHRAYPYWECPLNNLIATSPRSPSTSKRLYIEDYPLPDTSLPDHYEDRHDPDTPQITAQQITRMISGPVKPVGRRPA